MNKPILNSEAFERAELRFEGHVAVFVRAVEDIEQQVSRLARIAGMQADNQQRAHTGNSVAYDFKAFTEA